MQSSVLFAFQSRRGVVGLLMGGLAVLLGACTMPAPKHFDPIDHPLYELPVKTLWVARVGAIGDHQYRQLPTVIVDGKIYVATNHGEFGAIDARSGQVLWSGGIKDTIVAGPEVDDHGTVAISSSISSATLTRAKKTATPAKVLYVANDRAEILALQAPSLKVLWRSKISSVALQAPVIAGDKLVVQSIDGKISALSKSDGKVLWVEAREVPPLTLRGTARPLLDNDKIITGFANGSVSALSLSNGKVLWDTSIAVARGRSDVERVVDVDGLLYQDEQTVYACAMQGRIAAIAKKNGQLLWVRDMSAYSGVVSDGKALYVSDADSRLWALDIKTGATLWRSDDLKGRDISAPALMNDEIIVGDGDGYVHWLSKQNGKLQSQLSLNDIFASAYLVFGDESIEGRQPAVTTEPVVFGNAVYVRDNLGALTVFVVEKKEKDKLKSASNKQQQNAHNDAKLPRNIIHADKSGKYAEKSGKGAAEIESARVTTASSFLVTHR